MIRTILRWAAVGAAVVLALGAAVPAADDAPDALTDARFFSDASGSQGVFPGKLVCLCCDFQGGAGKSACKEKHHRLALKIAGDPTVHPLVPGDANAMKQLSAPDLHGKQVSVTGKLYPSVGIIVVAAITPQQ
jgi:hypothetical protein